MSLSRGTERFQKCLAYLESKYDPQISDETYNERLSEYLAFDKASRDLSKHFAESIKEADNEEDTSDNADETSESGDDDYEYDGFIVPDDYDEEEEDPKGKRDIDGTS